MLIAPATPKYLAFGTMSEYLQSRFLYNGVDIPINRIANNIVATELHDSTKRVAYLPPTGWTCFLTLDLCWGPMYQCLTYPCAIFVACAGIDATSRGRREFTSSESNRESIYHLGLRLDQGRGSGGVRSEQPVHPDPIQRLFRRKDLV